MAVSKIFESEYGGFSFHFLKFPFLEQFSAMFFKKTFFKSLKLILDERTVFGKLSPFSEDSFFSPFFRVECRVYKIGG